MKLFITLLFLLVVTLTLVPSASYAQLGINRGSQQNGMGLPVPAAGQSANSLSTIIRNVVTLFYSVGALGFTIMIIWGSVDWILSGGDKEKVAGGRKRITTALVGMFLLALSFPIIAIIAQISGVNILGELPLKKLTDP